MLVLGWLALFLYGIECTKQEPQAHLGIRCGLHEHGCHDNLRCIPKGWLCDGEADCFDGSDEVAKICDHAILNCSSHEFLCQSREKCIPASWHCDNTPDCADHSDEQHCGLSPAECNASHGKYLCGNSQCIDLQLVCDRVAQCGDSSDEGQRCGQGCINKQCSHNCQSLPTGFVCTCPKGYVIQEDGRTCGDIDECRTLPVSPCSQLCYNTPGTYHCACVKGYQSYGQECRAVDPDASLLYVSQGSLHTVTLDANSSHGVVARQSRLHHIRNIGYDSVDSRLYWSVIRQGRVMSSRLDGTDVQPVVTNGVHEIGCIAVDWIGRLLYMEDTIHHQLLVCALDGTRCAAIFNSSSKYTWRDIVVDAVHRVLYLSIWNGTHANIDSLSMDGMELHHLVSVSSGHPSPLALDLPTGQLYWVQHQDGLVNKIDLKTGTNRVAFEIKMYDPPSMVVFEDVIYWADHYLSSIHSVNKRTGKDRKTVLKPRYMIQQLVVKNTALQPAGINPCSGHLCDGLCVWSGEMADHRVSCICPKGRYLAADKFSCKDLPTTSSMLIAARTSILKVYPDFVGHNQFSPMMFPHLKNAIALDYDWSNEKVFYSDVTQDAIYQGDLTTGYVHPIVKEGLVTVDGVAVDWMAHNVYWTESTKALIEVSRLNGSSRKTLLYKYLDRPRGLAVHPLNGHLYFSDWGVSPVIERSDLDGKNRKVLVDRLGWPNSLTIDYEDSRLYWCDARFDHIESTGLDGQERRVVVRNVPHPFSITVLQQRIYWTDWDTTHLHYANKWDGGHQGQLLNYEGMMGIVAMAASRQQGTNACSADNGGCSHLCFAKPGGHFVCSCPEGMTVKDKTCEPLQGCPEDHIECDGKCISKELMCDGQKHCEDNRDEKDCTGHQCREYEFQCTNGQCIHSIWKCDQDVDCEDFSDETDCGAVTCKPGQFQCVSGMPCIEAHWVCDGTQDCPDNSDESSCRNRTCTIEEFQCQDGRCIPTSWYCDGAVDCEGGEDEVRDCGLLAPCQAEEWRCGNNACIAKSLRCDGKPDCSDHSDEVTCGVASECSPPWFQCTMGPCLPPHQVCDEHQQCPLGEDEKNCGLVTCDISEFLCGDNDTCIPGHWVCDGFRDCEDGVDEFECSRPRTDMVQKKDNNGNIDSAAVCGADMYQCGSGECLVYQQVCDGTQHCRDGSDEGGQCDSSCSTLKGGCSDICRSTPAGPVCQCREGFTLLSDGMVCIDVNECDQPLSATAPLCDQVCFNTKGSYRCDCKHGYQLQSDEKTCKASTGPLPSLLFAAGASVFTSHRDGSHLSAVVTSQHLIIALDYDWLTQTIYWSEADTIKSMKAGGSGDQGVHRSVVTGLSRPDGLAVDWVAGNIYYTDAGTKQVTACSGDGDVCSVLIHKSLDQPRAIVLHPKIGLMFWSDWGYDAKIERAWMDGQHRQLVIGDKVIWPNGLTVDFVLDRLYWVDAKFDHIEVADFNGQHRRVVTSRGMQHPFSVTVFEDTLYVSEWTTGTVTVLNKFSGDNRTSLPELFHRPMGIQVYHPLRQPTGYNYCEPLQPKCSHLCLLKPGGASCACPRGYTLEAGHLCQITKPFTSGATPEISGISSVATTPVYLDRKNTISLSASTAKSFFGPSTKAVHESNLELLKPQEGVTEKQQTASTMTTEYPAVPRGGSVAIDTDVTMTIPVSYKHPIATHKLTPPTVTARNQLDNVKGESGGDVTTVSSTTTRTLNEHEAQGAHTKSISMVTVQVPSNGYPEREHVDNEGPSVNIDLPNKTKLCIATCLNGGNCEGGICVCWKGFTGPSCEVMISSNLTNEKPEGKEEAGDLSIVVIPVMSVLVVITVIVAAVSCYCKKQRMKSHLLLIKYSNRHNQVKQTDEEHLVEHAFHNPAFASEEDESDHQNASLHNSQCTIVTSSDSSDSAFTDEKSDEQNT